jgi:hypothetical protein
MLEVVRTVASLGTVAGVLLAIFVYKRDRRTRRDDDIYRRVGTEWMEFLRFAAEHPDLDPMNTAIVLNRTTTSSEENSRILLHSFFATVAGRAWLAYRDQPEPVTVKRWAGWELYIECWIQRPDFPEFWEHYGTEYDADFRTYLDSLLHPARSESKEAPSIP